ncbi:MAG: hypothetical protein VR64_09955 [Desulfatitalea sp. BRH_c12]|nr:MAG: hypothetical protein VR64_09955 [Desulfatitalea sp. BRH_c12]
MTSTIDYQPPYKELYIYYLKGRIAGPAFAGGEAYIGNWEEAEDSFLFFKQPADAQISALLQGQPHLSLQDNYQMSYEEWQGHAVAPFGVGRLQVVPPWHPDAAVLDENGILLDPGVVFGTGSHPTTHDCLTAMHHAFDAGPVRDVLDLGTGTGLLALAAVRLGAQRVLAFDLNRLAVETTRRNVALNAMAGHVLVVQGNAANFMDIAADLMVSNIHFEVMRHLVSAQGFIRQKQFVLSGLLRTQARDIEYQLHRLPVDIVHKWERDGTWFTFYGRSRV